jgi:hypothetical protein
MKDKYMKRYLTQIIGLGLVLLSFNLSAAAQKTVAPIVSLSPEESEGKFTIPYGNLLGGVERGKWLDAKTTYGKLKGTEKFSLFDFATGKKGAFSLSKVQEDVGACPENFAVNPNLETSATLAVGTSANWMIVPRQPKKVSLTDPGYKQSVADLLRLHGLSKSPARLKDGYHVDLDGDGRDEVVLEAYYSKTNASGDSSVGSYSLIIVRKQQPGGKVQNILVGGYFLAKKADESDGDYAISGFADLNGDGKMELIVDVTGYEENWIKVYEIKGEKWAEIKALSYYCGV